LYHQYLFLLLQHSIASSQRQKLVSVLSEQPSLQSQKSSGSIPGQTIGSVKGAPTGEIFVGSDTVGESLGDEVSAEVGDGVGAEVGDEVGAEVGDEVGADVGVEVGAEVGDEVGRY